MGALSRSKSATAEVQTYTRLQQHLQTFRRMTVLPYDDAAASVANGLRKLRVGTMDLKIASIVLASDAVLITRNIADFRLVPGLRTEDWSIEA
jgi:tRNA(fMet)-specific endonuclease VapC